MTLYRYTGALNASRDGQPRCGASTDEGRETLNPSRASPYRYGEAPDAYGKAVNPYAKTVDLYGEALDPYGKALDWGRETLDRSRDAPDAAALPSGLAYISDPSPPAAFREPRIALKGRNLNSLVL